MNGIGPQSTKFDFYEIFDLLELEEKLRGHTFMKPVHDEIMSLLREHAEGKHPPNQEATTVHGPAESIPEEEEPVEPVSAHEVDEEEPTHDA